MWTNPANWDSEPSRALATWRIFSELVATTGTADLGSGGNVTVAGLGFGANLSMTITATDSSHPMLVLDGTDHRRHGCGHGGRQDHTISANVQLNTDAQITTTGSSSQLTIGGNIRESGGSFGLTKQRSARWSSPASTATRADRDQRRRVAGRQRHRHRRRKHHLRRRHAAVHGGQRQQRLVGTDRETAPAPSRWIRTVIPRLLPASSTAATRAASPSSAQDLTPTASNTYTGGTTVNGGTLSVGNGGSGASIGGTSGVVFSNGAEPHLQPCRPGQPSPRSISGNGSFTKTGTGTLTIAAAATYTGPTIVNAGTLKLQSNPVPTAPPVAGYSYWFNASNLGLSNGARSPRWPIKAASAESATATGGWTSDL